MRPCLLRGHTVRKQSPVGPVFVTLNTDNAGNPCEVFVTAGKAGSEVTSMAEALGRAITLLLTVPSKQSKQKRLDTMIEHMDGIGGGSVGLGYNKIKSMPDAIAKGLRDICNLLDTKRQTANLPSLDDEASDNADNADNANNNVDKEGNIVNDDSGNDAEDFFVMRSTTQMDICPECHSASYVREGGCCVCKQCGYSACG